MGGTTNGCTMANYCLRFPQIWLRVCYFCMRLEWGSLELNWGVKLAMSALTSVHPLVSEL